MSRDENVLVFPRSVLIELGMFQGLKFEHQPYVDRILSPGVATFIPRQIAENDETKKQIIPYVILIHDTKLLFYVRGREADETRLISKGSIGFGGHIQQEDDSLFHDTISLVQKIYRSAVDREVHEELMVEAKYDDHIVAVLNDDRDAVGRVHFGIVHIWGLNKPTVTKKEKQITRLGFLKPAEICLQPVQLEGWSQICLEQIEELIAALR